MNRIVILALTACFIALQCGAQVPAEKLTKWAKTNPIEKIYLHCDREDYVSGQTIWFKAYLASEFLPHETSSVVFVELLNVSSTVISRKSFPAVLAMANGQVELPDTLSSGNYTLRAYTATMLNHPADFIFTKRISITGKDNRNVKRADVAAKKLRVEFFPEGGNLVAGHPNTIAFKISDETAQRGNSFCLVVTVPLFYKF